MSVKDWCPLTRGPEVWFLNCGEPHLMIRVCSSPPPPHPPPTPTHLNKKSQMNTAANLLCIAEKKLKQIDVWGFFTLLGTPTGSQLD